MNGKIINNIRYADDSVIIASSQAELQMLMNKIVEHSETYGLPINAQKIKTLVFSKKQVKLAIAINDINIEQVFIIKYLEIILNENCESKQEIRASIEKGQETHSYEKPIRMLRTKS